MNNFFTQCFICTLFFCSAAAYADVFKCVTASGKVITSDRVIPECANRSTKVFKNNGALKKEILPPLTEAEKLALAEAAEKKRALDAAQDLRRKEERYLLAHYSNEQDIQIARQKSIDVYAEKKKLTSDQLVSLKASITELNQLIAKTPKGSSSLASLNIRASELQISILKAQESLKTYDEEIAQTHKRFDETVVRFRTIIGKR